MLVVIQSFAGYKRGDRITDPALAATILSTEDARNVITVGVPGESTPAPVQKTLFALLTEIANGGGKPKLIDALPDAEGNPPSGYAWLPGMASVPNFGCALTDYAGLANATLVPCQNGFVGASAFVPANGYLTLTITNSQTNTAFFAVATTLAGLKAATLVGAYVLSDSTVFIVYKGQLADNSWSLFSGVLASDGTITLAATLPIPATYDTLAVPQALAKLGNYYVYAITGLHYVLIDVSTGASYIDPFVPPIGYTPNAEPRGLIIASDANGLYVQRRGEPVIIYVAISVTYDDVDGYPKVIEGEVETVMPIPGGSLASLVAPYVPLGACTLPNGNLVLCTRAGFFEVRSTLTAGAVSVVVRQTAGVHPLVPIAVTALNNNTDDVRWARYDVPRGLLHIMSGRNEIVVDYTTLKSLYVRKAHLIA